MLRSGKLTFDGYVVAVVRLDLAVDTVFVEPVKKRQLLVEKRRFGAVRWIRLFFAH